jgi:putative ABC transport system permease protein
METLWRDVRHGLRALARKPVLAVVVVTTLALGIGANTAIFSVVYSILLRPFPYREPDRLIRIESLMTETGAVRGSSLPDVEDWRRRNQTLSDLGAYTTFDADIRGDGPALPVRMTHINPSALAILGVEPILGRHFLPEEDVTGGDAHKAIVSHELWQSHFGGDPSILGRTLHTGLTPLEVVGVFPPAFAFPARTDVWSPMESWYALAVGERRIKQRTNRFYPVVGRLKPGATIEHARADLDRVAADLEREYTDNAGVRTRLTTLRDAEVGNIRPYLRLMLGAVSFVLLICCANVANLMLARALSRHREMALRAALGASRARVIRALLTESVLLSLTGGLTGIGVAFLAVPALLSLIPVALPFWMKIQIDLPVLVVSCVVAVATGLLFGAAPALHAARADVQGLLKEGARGSSGRGSRLQGSLVAAEVSLAVLLLVGAGLLVKTFLRLHALDTGFRAENLLVARVTNFQAGSRAEAAAALASFHERVLTGIRALPGVLSAGATNGLPYTRTEAARRNSDLLVRGRTAEEVRQTVYLEGEDVSPGYFDAMGIPLLQGRYIDARDTSTSPMVVVVSESAARILWPDRDPLGQEVFWGAGPPGPENPYCTVVGVVGGVRHRAFDAGEGVELYYPYTQYPVRNVYYVVRTEGDPQRSAASVRRAIEGVSADAGIVFTKTMEQLIVESLWQQRLLGVLLSIFAALAVALAAVGIYGVLAYAVTERTREIGVRVAFGASGGSVVGLVLRKGLRLFAIGLGLGLIGALFLTRILSSLLYDVTPYDPVTFAGVAGLLTAVTLVACYIPARRAARLDPLVALRSE